MAREHKIAKDVRLERRHADQLARRAKRDNLVGTNVADLRTAAQLRDLVILLAYDLGRIDASGNIVADP